MVLGSISTERLTLYIVTGVSDNQSGYSNTSHISHLHQVEDCKYGVDRREEYVSGAGADPAVQP